jgi:hypothetical protein
MLAFVQIDGPPRVLHPLLGGFQFAFENDAAALS